MEATSMNINGHNSFIGIDYEITLFIPDWIGRIICKRKDHSWEILGEVCNRCGFEGVTNE